MSEEQKLEDEYFMNQYGYLNGRTIDTQWQVTATEGKVALKRGFPA